MKSLLSIFSFLFMAFNFTNCAAQKEVSDIKEVVYEAMTRGNSLNMKVVATEMEYKTPQDSKVYTLTSEEREALEKAIAKVDLKTINTLKAPTNKRVFDGAMHTTITIKKGENTFVSSVFDDGHPPAELEALVKLLHSFKK